MKNKTIFVLIFTLYILQNVTFGQNNDLLNENIKDPSKNLNQANLIFKDIENGFNNGDISYLSVFLSAQTYLNLSNGVNGYYSSNQAYYVLEDFLKTHQVAQFKFDNVQLDEGDVCGTGAYEYVFRGKRETAQVYVSLKRLGKKWKITQITIN
jgi:hypothetical protein